MSEHFKKLSVLTKILIVLCKTLHIVSDNPYSMMKFLNGSSLFRKELYFAETKPSLFKNSASKNLKSFPVCICHFGVILSSQFIE